MRYRVVHYCNDAECGCNDRNGVIAYDGPDAAEAAYWVENAPAGYVARDESEEKAD